MLDVAITTIHILVCFFLVLVVLVQGGNSGGVGAAFGGGNSSGVFGATGAVSLLGKLTYASAGIFLLTSIYLVRDHKTDIIDRVKERGAVESTSSESAPESNEIPPLEAVPAGQEATTPEPAKADVK